jgi:hypothetical protein
MRDLGAQVGFKEQFKEFNDLLKKDWNVRGSILGEINKRLKS